MMTVLPSAPSSSSQRYLTQQNPWVPNGRIALALAAAIVTLVMINCVDDGSEAASGNSATGTGATGGNGGSAGSSGQAGGGASGSGGWDPGMWPSTLNYKSGTRLRALVWDNQEGTVLFRRWMDTDLATECALARA